MALVAERKLTQEKTVATETAISTSPPKPVAGSPCVGPALLTGAMLWACHFPLAWGWVSWIALVPLLTLARAQATSKRIYWSAYLGGLAFFVPVLQWMRVADYRMYATWIMLATYCALYFPAALWLIRALDRRGVPFCFNVAIVWVGLEWVRSFALTGFAWYYLGHAQHQLSSLIQIADLGGVYAISFLVAAVNGLLCDLAFHLPALRDRFRWRETAVGHVSQLRPRTSWLWLQGLVIAGAITAAILYGNMRLDETAFFRGPRVALLQTSIEQDARNNPALFNTMMVQNTSLPYLACLGDAPPDLIVWPETSYIGIFTDVSTELPTEKVNPEHMIQSDAIRRDFRGLAYVYPAPHLVGISTEHHAANGKTLRYNSALLVDDNGTPTQRFDKMHRVPFGEYVPLRDWIPFMNALAPYDHDYSISIGQTFTRFQLKDAHFGALICFEDSDPALARRYTAEGEKPVDFFVNMSNDGWFRGTSEHEEHLTVSRFRAIENRRALVRSVNMGISAVIDPNGVVLKPTPVPADQPNPNFPSSNKKLAQAQKAWEEKDMWNLIKKWGHALPAEKPTIWEVLPNAKGMPDELPVSEYSQYKKNTGVLIATVPIDRRTSLYSRWGDWLPMGCWGLCLAAFGLSFVRGRFIPTRSVSEGIPR